MGVYNGQHTFNAFTHRRAVLDKATWLDSRSMYPPFSKGTLGAINNIADGIKVPKTLITAGLLVLAGGAAIAVAKL